MNKLASVIILGAVAAVTTGAPADTYTSRYEHLDVDSILNNRRMVNYYAACLLSQGPCPPQGLELKRILPEGLQSNCARCTEKQRTIAFRAIRRLRKEYPKTWDQLAAVWDPDGSQIKKFEQTFESPSNNAIIPAEETPLLADRFGGDGTGVGEPDESDTVAKTTVKPPPSVPISTSSSPSTTTKPSTTTSFVSLTTKPATYRPPSISTVGANLQATVSFATNIVGGVVRGLGNLGTQVVETGARIADAVIQAVVTFMASIKKIVIQLYQHKLDSLNRILSGRYYYDARG